MWIVKDCFVGEECWCGIIVTPDGEECNPYGEISREDCQYIVDALNKTPGAESNVNKRHPVPWHVEEFPEHRRKIIVTTAGLGKDSLEECIGCVFNDQASVFVESVNRFYSRST